MLCMANVGADMSRDVFDCYRGSAMPDICFVQVAKVEVLNFKVSLHHSRSAVWCQVRYRSIP